MNNTKAKEIVRSDPYLQCNVKGEEGGFKFTNLK